MRIAVDAMGGDHAPDRPVAGVLAALGEPAPDFEIVLVGDESRLNPLLSRHSSDRLSVLHAPEAIGMDESPASALRRKKSSSIAVGMDLQKRGLADAFVSAGNTGAVMAAALYAVLAYMTWMESPDFKAAWDAPGVDPALLKALFLIFIELMLVTAIAVFFSTFSTPILSAALTFGFYVAGNFNADLRNFEQVVRSPAAAWLARALYHVLPDLSAFDVKTQVVHGLPVSAGYIWSTAAYGAAYIAALLLAATVVFSRRDFK